jgi:2-isopropylmalate synthase
VPLDPEDIGRQFEGIIRINSQSGKGGVAFVMEQEFGCQLPKQMQPEFSAVVQKASDASGDELTPLAIWNIFSDTYLRTTSPFAFSHFTSLPVEVGSESYIVELAVTVSGSASVMSGRGNGPIDACRSALIRSGCEPFRIANYLEHARTSGSDAEAVAFIQVEDSSGRMIWGAGIHPNIETASIRALLSALNRLSIGAVDDVLSGVEVVPSLV